MSNWVTSWACAHRAVCFTNWNQDSFSYEIDNNISGTAIRLNYSNWYGDEDVEIIDACATINNREFHFLHDGRNNIIIKAGEFINRCSDPIMTTVVPGKIKVTIKFADKKRPGSGQTFMTPPGISMILQAVEVLTEENIRVIGALGDSITHWGKWIGPLRDELYEEYKGKISIFEMAINGSRLLNDSPVKWKHSWGYDAKRRLEHDILPLSGLTDCIFALGLNDLGIREENGNEILTLEKYKQTTIEIVDRLHEKGVKVIGLTILPRDYFHCEEEDVYSPKRNELRKDINKWILEEAPFDMVINAAENVRNDDDSCMLPQYVCADGVHLNDEGGIVVKNTIKAKLVI